MCVVDKQWTLLLIMCEESYLAMCQLQHVVLTRNLELIYQTFNL